MGIRSLKRGRLDYSSYNDVSGVRRREDESPKSRDAETWLGLRQPAREGTLDQYNLWIGVWCEKHNAQIQKTIFLRFARFELFMRAIWNILTHAINLKAVNCTMGFEQLAGLRDRLRAENEQVQADSTPRLKRKASPQAKSPREQDPAMEAIWPLQKHFPLAFPVSPAPKVPLKEGILEDAEQHLELLGITREQLKLGISIWCRGKRYWTSMVENAPRMDLYGQSIGIVTAGQAMYAKQQASKQRSQDRRNRAESESKASVPVADVPKEQTTD